jgi:Kef-type K+ transport system membrane component KefB
MLSFPLAPLQRGVPVPTIAVPWAVAAPAEAEIGPILLAIFVVFVAAKVAGEVLERLGQPAVVGELIAGVIVGPSVLGWVPLDGAQGEVMLVLAELGVIVLLFQVGLETDPKELRAVGGNAAAVGVLGVLFPFAGGFAATMIAGNPALDSAFVATALVATSVGITARVLGDLGKLTARPSRVILGAAVIDDILGLMVLAVVVGLSAGSLDAVQISILLSGSIAFVGSLLLIGPRVVSKVAYLFEAPKIPRSPFAVAVAILLGLSVVADRLNLAVIVGAFLAGSVLSATRDRYQLERQFEPVADFLTPFFFVVTGARVDLGAFTRPGVLVFAAVITIIAVTGKLLGGYLGARGMSRRDRWIVGVGMVPRGEVGIIVAGLALSHGIVGEDLFGAVLLMVVMTTIFAPPFLRPLFARPPRDGHATRPAAATEDPPSGT